MQIGEKVKTIFGNIETVMGVEDARIATFESFCTNPWHHPTKVFRYAGAKLWKNM